MVTTTLCLTKNPDTYGPRNPAVDSVSTEKRGEFRERKKVGLWGWEEWMYGVLESEELINVVVLVLGYWCFLGWYLQ